MQSLSCLIPHCSSCFLIRFFLTSQFTHGCIVEYKTKYVIEGPQSSLIIFSDLCKNHLREEGMEDVFLSHLLHNVQHRDYFGHLSIFAWEWDKKYFPNNKLVLKRSVLKKSLPNSQHKLLLTSLYEDYVEAAQKKFRYATIFALTPLVVKHSILKQSLPNSQHKLL